MLTCSGPTLSGLCSSDLAPPGGGEIVEAHFLDADGYPLDGPDGAAHVEIHVRYPAGSTERARCRVG